jgi:hypothetical protein
LLGAARFPLAIQQRHKRHNWAMPVDAPFVLQSGEHDKRFATAGSYTAIVCGFNNSTGNALVEVYNLE